MKGVIALFCAVCMMIGGYMVFETGGLLLGLLFGGMILWSAS